jgi:hypothetical protein
VLDVDKRRQSTALLRLRNHGQGKRRLSGGLRAENFYHSPPWKSADAESAIDQNVARRYDVDIDDFLVAKAHDCAFTIIFGYLLNRQIKILISRRSQFVSGCFFFRLCRHIRITLSTTQPTIRQAEKQSDFDRSKGKRPRTVHVRGLNFGEA